MKKFTLTMIALFCIVVLAACGEDADAPDYPTLPEYSSNETDYPSHDSPEDCNTENAETEGNAPEQYAASTAQPVQPTTRRMWPVVNPYAGGRGIPQGFRVEIARKSDVFLDFFDDLHEFDYNLVRETRGHSGGGFYESAQTHTFVIWSNRPMTDVTMITFTAISLSGSSARVPFDSFSIAAELQVREGLVVSNYVGSYHASSWSWSGISFVDEYGVRRYFSIYYRPFSGDFLLREFENRSYLWPEGRLPWWTFDREDLEAQLVRWSWWNNRPVFDAPCYDRRAELLEQAGISEYGWQAAADFLRSFDSIFTPIGFPITSWDSNTNAAKRTGGYHAWLDQTKLNERPDVVFFNHLIYGHDTGFFNRDGNQITGVLWLTEWHYANYFSLFDFDGNGIPDIIVHFQQTFEGCYGGFYLIFRYNDGAYVQLEMPAHAFTATNRLFVDEYGRIITFSESELHGLGISHMALTDHRAEFHNLLYWAYNTWHEWYLHHWRITEQTPYGSILLDDWLANNPTIFGTDIGITPLDPFYDLGAELMAYLLMSRE